uniref:Taste receptor type 2 n=1 Tax=Neogobius melanostomus TaxID=47308 RepID=A0A8C6USW8_9GOBI
CCSPPQSSPDAAGLTTIDMLGATKLAIWIITGLFAVTTVFFNLFILLSSLSRYQHTKQWSPSETIVVALSGANLVHQLICYLWMSMDEIDHECNLPPLPYSVLLTLLHSFKFTIMWYVSFLTFYYSTKLVHTPNRLYTLIQAIILKQVTLGVVLIPLCAVGVCMPALVLLQSEKNSNTTTVNQDCGLWRCFPGLLMVKCCVSIPVHLAIHLQHMTASTNGAHGPKLGSQLRVIQMALSLVAIFLVFLVVDLYVNYQIAVYHDNTIMLTFLFTSIFTTVTPMVLIYGKTSFWKSFLHEYNTGLDEYPCHAYSKGSRTKGSNELSCEMKREKKKERNSQCLSFVCASYRSPKLQAD